tara:strand:+ start:332563 stop:332925 length:363 start_codon:yes stop_codon:yes gene_type:complete
MDPELTDEIRMLEESHLLPTIRMDRDQLALILHESFIEIGASGQFHTRQDVLDHLPDEDTSLRTLKDFVAQMLSDNLALTTYTIARTDLSDGHVHRSRRSSVWIRERDAWRLRFHQGTPM